MKELRFSIQCGASNRKALVSRRCSQCTIDNNDIELDEIPQEQQSYRDTHINRSLSSTSINLEVPKHRPVTERTSDSDKFDTLLMLAADRTHHLDRRRKKYLNDSNTVRRHRHSSASPQRKDVPLLLIEQKEFNHVPSVRSHQVHFSTNAGMFKITNERKENVSLLFLDSSVRSSLRIPHYEDDDGDPNAADISSGSTSSTNLRPLPRISRL
jgi:hypothetical protein